MTWSRFDDAARKHPKSTMSGNEAWGMWVAAIMFANQFGTDGFIPDAALADLLPCPIPLKRARSLAEKLCQSRMRPDGPGLLVRDDERGGYVVNDFLLWNPSKAETEMKRLADRNRKKGDRNPSGRDDNVRTESERNPNGVQTDSEPSRAGAPARALPRPGPTDPGPADPVQKDPPVAPPSGGPPDGGLRLDPAEPETPRRRGRGKGAGAVVLPETWAPSLDAVALAKELGLDVSDQASRMSDWARGKGARKADWDATFRNWLRQSADRGGGRASSAGATRRSDGLEDLEGLL